MLSQPEYVYCGYFVQNIIYNFTNYNLQDYNLQLDCLQSPELKIKILSCCILFISENFMSTDSVISAIIQATS